MASASGRIPATLVPGGEAGHRRRRLAEHIRLPGPKEFRSGGPVPLDPDPSRSAREPATAVVRPAIHYNSRRRHGVRHMESGSVLLGIALTPDPDELGAILRHPLLCGKLASGRNILTAVRLIIGHQTAIRHLGSETRISGIGGGELGELSGVRVEGIRRSIEIGFCRKAKEFRVHICLERSFLQL